MLLSEIKRIPYPESLEAISQNPSGYVRLNPADNYILVEQFAGFAAHKCDRISSTRLYSRMFKIEYYGFPEAPQRPLFEGLPIHSSKEDRDYTFSPILALFYSPFAVIQYHEDGIEVEYMNGKVVSEKSIPCVLKRVTVTIAFGREL